MFKVLNDVFVRVQEDTIDASHVIIYVDDILRDNLHVFFKVLATVDFELLVRFCNRFFIKFGENVVRMSDSLVGWGKGLGHAGRQVREHGEKKSVGKYAESRELKFETRCQSWTPSAEFCGICTVPCFHSLRAQESEEMTRVIIGSKRVTGFPLSPTIVSYLHSDQHLASLFLGTLEAQSGTVHSVEAKNRRPSLLPDFQE
jgi:hypothetical protein